MADNKKTSKKHPSEFKGGFAIHVAQRKINNAYAKAEKTKGKNRIYWKEVAKIHENELKDLRKKYPNTGIKQGPKQTVYQKNPKLIPLMKGRDPKLGVLTGRRGKRTIKGDITKKMNMGGVMKSRGGTFKGVF